jgi:hypothetical protein
MRTVLSLVRMWLIRRIFGLDERIFLHLIPSHTLWLQAIQRYHYSTRFPVHRCTHTGVLSVFTSRTLPTDLSQSHWHFNSHVKSSWHRLIPFLSLSCDCQLSSIPSSYPGRLVSRNQLTVVYNYSFVRFPLYSRGMVSRKTPVGC